MMPPKIQDLLLSNLKKRHVLKKNFFQICSIDRVRTVDQGMVRVVVKKHALKKMLIFNIIEYGIFGEGSQILTDQKRESTVFSLLIS